MKIPATLSCICLVLLFAIPMGCRTIKSVGKSPSGKKLRALQALPNYTADGFINLSDAPPRRIVSVSTNTNRNTGIFGKVRIFRMLRGKPDTVRPKQVVPVVKTDLVNTNYD